MAGLVYRHALDPFVFQFKLGSQVVGLRWYALAYILGFVLAYYALKRARAAGRPPGLTSEGLERLIMALILGVMVGGRLGFVAQHPHEVLRDPLFVFKVWEGGMAFFGGLIGVILAVFWSGRREGIAPLALGDVLTIPAAVALGFGRIANFINGELWGTPTGGSWGVIYPHVDETPRHPAELYMAASHFLLALCLLVASRIGWFRQRDGRLGFLFLALYGAFRFVTDFVRESEVFVGPFNNNQVASFLLFDIGVILLLLSLRSRGQNSADSAR